MNKTFKILMVSLLLALALTGCTKSPDEKDDDQVTIGFSYWDDFDEDIFDKFEEENPNIKIDFIKYPDGEYSQKINTMLIGGTAPDVMITFEADLPRFAEEGLVIDMEEYISSSEVIKDDDFISAVDGLNEMVDGQYGLPWSYASEILYYNKDIFDEAGIDYPNDEWTWEKYAEVAKELTIKDGDNTEIWGSDSINFRGIWYSMMGAYGDPIVENNKVVLGGGMKKALEIENKMVNVDKSTPAPQAGDSITDLFQAGTAAMNRTGSWMTAIYSDLDFNWGIAPLPKGTEDYTTLHTGFYAINAESENKDEAWKFIEFMMSEEGQSMTTKFSHNPSAINAYAEKGEYKNEGVNGPGSWDVFDWAADNGEFGYVLANPSATSNIIDQFEAYVLGESTLEDVENTIANENENLD